MPPDKGKGILSQLEDRLGLPKLSQLVEGLEKVPDARQLKTVKEVLTLADRISQTAPQVDKVIELIKVVQTIPESKLDKLAQVLRVATRVSQSAPELNSVIGLVREINTISEEKMEKLGLVLRRIEEIVKKAPKELLEFLTSLKEQ